MSLGLKESVLLELDPMHTKPTPRSINTPWPPRPYAQRIALNIQKGLIHTSRAQSHGPQLGPSAELTCLWQVLRSDLRVLSYELWSSTQAPRLELSLHQRKGYLLALGGLCVLLVVARRTKRFWEDISPYSIVSVHVAFHQLLEGIVACPSHYHFT